MRTLGIDVGSKRVGVALSDAGGKLASPHSVLAASTAIVSILKIIEMEGVERLVVGLPLNMDDTLGPAARGAIAFGRDLASRSGRPVLFIDERLSSFAAEQILADRHRGGEHLTRQKKKRRLDALAATTFLQDFLSGKLKPIAVDALIQE